MKNTDQIKALFQEKVKIIESYTNKDLMIHFEMQVGPDDAVTIMNQMEGFFISGYRAKELEQRAPAAWYRDRSFIHHFSLGPIRPENGTSNPHEWKALYHD